jgi:xylan 1,4-beta-xylosidase
LIFAGRNGQHRALVSRVDASHGSVLTAYEAMGRPAYPTAAQIKKLQQVANLPPPEAMLVQDKKLELTLPPDGLALIELR